MKALAIVPVAALALGAFAGPGGKTSDLREALSYHLVDARTNKPVSLHDLTGKYKAIYIDFYASWCPDCKRALPEVVKLHRQLADKNVLFIGMDVWDQWYAMKSHMEKNQLPWMVLHDPDESSGKGISSLFGVTNIPTVIILNGKTLEEKGFFVDEKAVHLDGEVLALKELGVE